MDITIVGGVSSAIIVGILMQAIKISRIPKRWLPVVSLVVGILVVVIGTWSISNAFLGIIIGAMASGGYDIIKKSVLNK